MQAIDDCWFDHEKLDVYRDAIAFVAWVSEILEPTIMVAEARDLLDRASARIALHIAEGNGKQTPKDRSHYFDMAHGAALECASGLDILVAKGKIMPDLVRPGKERLLRIVRVLAGLIKKNSAHDTGMRE